jgi:hypothetical protein
MRRIPTKRQVYPLIIWIIMVAVFVSIYTESRVPIETVKGVVLKGYTDTYAEGGGKYTAVYVMDNQSVVWLLHASGWLGDELCIGGTYYFQIRMVPFSVSNIIRRPTGQSPIYPVVSWS